MIGAALGLLLLWALFVPSIDPWTQRVVIDPRPSAMALALLAVLAVLALTGRRMSRGARVALAAFFPGRGAAAIRGGDGCGPARPAARSLFRSAAGAVAGRALHPSLGAVAGGRRGDLGRAGRHRARRRHRRRDRRVGASAGAARHRDRGARLVRRGAGDRHPAARRRGAVLRRHRRARRPRRAGSSMRPR